MHNEHYCEPYIEQSPYGIETGGMKWVGRALAKGRSAQAK